VNFKSYLFGMLAVLVCANARAAIISDYTRGDVLSNSNNNPTNLGTLPIGISTVRGFVEAARTVGDVDVFTITIPVGTRLTTMNMSQYSGDTFAYILMDEGTSFPYNANQLRGNVDQTLFIGGAPFGTAIGTTGTYDLLSLGTAQGIGIGNRSVGQQPLRDFPIVPPSSVPPTYDSLEANTYTVYIQQESGVTTYTLNLTVEAIPEPSSLVLLVASGFPCFLLRRSRRESARC
jgi:hypothetical protein